MSIFPSSNTASKFNYVTGESLVSSKTTWTPQETGSLPPTGEEINYRTQ